MAITLPDFTSLPQTTPQAGGNLLQYPQNDPGAVALGELGKGAQAAGGALVDIAAYRDIAQTKADSASADADFSNAAIPLAEQLKVETDPEKITALRGQFRAALESAGGNFTNPAARDFWMKKHAGTVATYQSEADLRNSEVYRDTYNAGVLRKGQSVVSVGAAAEDPIAYGIQLHNIDQLTQSALQAGTLTAVKERELNAQLKADLVLGRIDNLITRNKPDEATALLDTNRTMLGGVAAARAEAAIATHGVASRTQGAAQRALGIGGAPVGGTAPGPTGPGQTSAAEHYTYLISQGASPNEAALLTSAAGAESGFNSMKPHDAEALATQGLPPGYGLYGHNGARLTAMQQQAGTTTPSWQQQAQFALGELRSRPEGAAVNGATTPEQLTDLQFQFEQPKRGPGDQSAERLASTREYMTNPPQAPAAGAGGPGGGIIDKTSDAGFGQKFGPLETPQGMIIHHTAGGGSVDDVINTFKKTGYPSQFVIDRQGKIYETLPDGYQGRHIRDSWGPLGTGRTNSNMEGVEIIANNDGDVLPVQQQAAARLVAMRAAKFGYDPRTSVFGHGEVNPGHKEADEGMSTVTRIRNGSLSVAAAAPAPGAPAPAAAPPAAPPAPPAPAAAAGGARQIDSAGGDSISAQQANSPGVAVTVDKSKANGPIGKGTARVGDNPHNVNERLALLPKGTLKGNFLLSTGASNTIDPTTRVANLDDLNVINFQIDNAKEAGAATVLIPGVGPGVANQTEVNKKLKRIADDNGAIFFEPKIKWQSDGIHPANHREMRAAAAAALPDAAGAAPAAPAAPPPKGQLEPGNIPLNPPS